MARPAKHLSTVALLVLASLAVSACHFDGHMPPGHVKQILTGPPGHAKKR